MNKIYFKFLFFITVIFSLILCGCSATTRNINIADEVHYDANYDFSDKKQIVDKLVNPLLLSTFLPSSAKKPILIIYPIANETSEHINTGGITDDIRMKLLKNGKFRFINERQRKNIQKEIQYQNKGYVSPSMQIQQGRQLGADYILSGTLRSIEKKQPKQWRLNRKEMIYYSLDLSMTDLRTAEIVYADQAEIAREASKPIIGW